MSKPSIASQLAAIQKQRDLLAKKEAALKAESHGRVLIQIVKMAKDAGLTLVEITHAYESQKNKSIPTTKTTSKKTSIAKGHTMKGVKLPAKYRNPLNPTQTWTGRGVDPTWVAKLRESGLLETALIQVATEVVSSAESLN
jgi:DNA-binding protein H-NS